MNHAPIPHQIARNLKIGWIGGFILGIYILGQTLYFSSVNLDNFFYPFSILILSFGIYKKSRSCALLLFLYFLGYSIFFYLHTGKIHGLILILIFLATQVFAIKGTYQYQAWLKSQSPPPGNQLKKL